MGPKKTMSRAAEDRKAEDLAFSTLELDDSSDDEDIEIPALKASAGVISKVTVGDNDLLNIKVKGRPSGKMPDGRHGDHYFAQIFSAHNIRRLGNGIDVSKIDDLRDVRESIFNFITCIVVVNSTYKKPSGSNNSSLSSSGVSNAGYEVNISAKEALYSALNDILRKYNAKRYKETDLKKLENGFQDFWAQGKDDLKLVFEENISKNRASNRDLICETFARLIELTSTFYYNIPNTSYPIIPGYEASKSEGGNINAVLKKLDALCDELNKKTDSSSAYTLRARVPKNLKTVAKKFVDDELLFREQSLEKLSDNAEKIAIAEYKISGLQSCSSNPLKYIALKLKEAFHYPEILGTVNPSDYGRNNDQDEFYDKVAKYLFVIFNTYPEFSDDREEIVALFLTEVINYQTVGASEQGWPSLRSLDYSLHTTEVMNRLVLLEITKDAHLYIKTEGYRSRASSGAKERMQEQILDPAIAYIRDKFDLEDTQFSELVAKLYELPFEMTDDEYRQQAFEFIEDFCKGIQVEEEDMDEIKNILVTKNK